METQKNSIVISFSKDKMLEKIERETARQLKKEVLEIFKYLPLKSKLIYFMPSGHVPLYSNSTCKINLAIGLYQTAYQNEILKENTKQSLINY